MADSPLKSDPAPPLLEQPQLTQREADGLESAPTGASSALKRHRDLDLLANYFAAEESELQRLLYDRIRLGILSALSIHRWMSFAELKDLLKTSDGNLSTHAKRLESAGYILCRKRFQRRIPKTEYQLTAEGRRALVRFIDHMEALVRIARPD